MVLALLVSPTRYPGIDPDKLLRRVFDLLNNLTANPLPILQYVLYVSIIYNIVAFKTSKDPTQNRITVPHLKLPVLLLLPC